MPRAEVQFIVVSPAELGTGEPVLAKVPQIFLAEPESPNRLVEMPRMVDDRELCAGLIVRGFGQIFAKEGVDVHPTDLTIEPPSEPNKPRRNYIWD